MNRQKIEFIANNLASLRLKTMSLNIAQQFMKGMVKNLFWFIKNSDEFLDKLKSRGFLASCLSTYYFSTFYIHCFIV